MITAWILATARAEPELAGWQVLRDDAVWIGCTWADDEPWCRAIGRLDARPEVVLERLDLADWPEVFTHVGAVRPQGDGVYALTLDLPFALAPREHVARFEQRREEGALVLAWEPVEHAHEGDAVCLPRHAGAWRLVPDGGATEVSFTWQADLAGEVPDWALPRARMTLGEQVLAELHEALGREVSSTLRTDLDSAIDAGAEEDGESAATARRSGR